MNQFKWCQHSILVGLCLMCHTIRADEPNREQIGKVLGKPVYRDQVTREGEGSLKSQLNDAFIVPVRLKYLHDHRNELEFSADELAFFSLYFDEKQTNEKNAGSPKLTEGKAIEKKSIKGELAEIESRLSTGTLTTEEREAALKDKDAVSQRLKKLVEHNRELLRLQADQFFFGPTLSRHLYKTYGDGAGQADPFEGYHTQRGTRKAKTTVGIGLQAMASDLPRSVAPLQDLRGGVGRLRRPREPQSKQRRNQGKNRRSRF
jgi:hypothetical protein